MIIEGIDKSYGKTSILKDVSLEIPKNRLVAFIGSNGAGKSTLLSIMSRTLDKDKGHVLLEQKEILDWNQSLLAKKLSILKQSNHNQAKITVRELIEFGRFPHSRGKLTKEDYQKVNEAITYMNLDTYTERFLDELSGGQRQMAYIAMIIAQDSEYIFLDEPLNNLDMKHSQEMMYILSDLVKNHGKSIVVVIHDINFVANYANYIIAMKDGVVRRVGPIEELLNSEVLKEIYDIDIAVHDFNGFKHCMYYK